MYKLLNEIVNCENIKKVRNGDKDCVCRNVIKVQNNTTPFQVPEPWNGNLQTAKILFISSNPSIDSKEEYPNALWKKEIMEDFFINRFSKERIWVKNELMPLKIGGEYGGWVRFWAAVRGIAKSLLNKQPIAGQDYAITEIVHCKSTNEIGVKEAQKECVEKYLSKILECSNAKVIVCLGDKVSSVICQYYLGTEMSARSKPYANGVDSRVFIFLPHPNARKRRKLDYIFETPEAKDKLNEIKDSLK
ncbi:MAG: hypothetical protein KBG80_09365 [Breznakibacter sp.]|nr:hypothetical protein [Breznakibacter sp.]